NGATYYWKIIFWDDKDEGALSETGRFTMQAIPEIPTNCSANKISNTQIDISWTDNSLYEDIFKIERSTDGGGYT
ncbi:MAG: hypothetical protein COY82_01705, partial [Parcubacteria group bacterium CG_4_10_14_0_8_um_filter_35_7]